MIKILSEGTEVSLKSVTEQEKMRTIFNFVLTKEAKCTVGSASQGTPPPFKPQFAIKHTVLYKVSNLVRNRPERIGWHVFKKKPKDFHVGVIQAIITLSVLLKNMIRSLTKNF